MAEEKNHRPKIVMKKGSGNSGDKENKGSGSGLPRFSMSWVYILIAAFLLFMLYFPGGGEESLQTRELHEMLENNEVAKIEVANDVFQ